MNKETLRKVYLEKRLSLSREEKDRRDRILCNIFMEQVKDRNIRYLHLFLPIAEKNEPDTFLLIERLRKEKPEIEIVVPRILSGHELEHIRLQNPHTIEFNHWGIPEPRGGEPFDISKLDMVLLPLVIFDRKGSRIGYGKGFYDRFLSELPQETLTIGYTLTVPLDKIPYIESHDVPMDACICPLGYLEFG